MCSLDIYGLYLNPIGRYELVMEFINKDSALVVIEYGVFCQWVTQMLQQQ